MFNINSRETMTKTIHTCGQIFFRCVNDIDFKFEFARFERLIDHQRCFKTAAMQ